MASKQKDRLPAGHQPYESLVAVRVGAIAGALAGGAAAVAAGTAEVWFILAGTLIGAAAGFRFHSRNPG